MNMKAFGGIALLVAAVLVWLAISAGIESSGMRSRVNSYNTGWTKVINDMSGASDIAESRIRGVETMGVQFAIGAVIMGAAGAAFMVVKRRRRP